jgi:hypothetical protein
VLGILFLVFVAASFSALQRSKQTTATQPVPAARTYSFQEKLFNTAALAYLRDLAASDAELARIMNSANQGGSLAAIYDGIRSARAEQDRLWARFKVVSAPAEVASVNEEIERCRDLHRDAFREMLDYGGDPVHTAAGTELIVRAGESIKECLYALGASAGVH